jgi:hypothetical protein
MNMNDELYEPRTEYGAAFAHGKALAAAELAVHTFDEAPRFALFPDGKKLLDLEKFQPLPDAVKRAAAFYDLDSLAEYTERYRTDEALAYFDPNVGITVVFDENKPSTRVELPKIAPAGKQPETQVSWSPGAPAWRRHRASYVFRYTASWRSWVERDGMPMEQEEFLEFLETNAEDVASPTAESLLEAVENFRSFDATRLDRSVNRLTGSVCLNLQTGNANGNQEFPCKLQLLLRPLERGSSFSLSARLRYRKENDSLKFYYILDNPQRTRMRALDEAREKAKELLKLPVLNGSPE